MDLEIISKLQLCKAQVTCAVPLAIADARIDF